MAAKTIEVTIFIVLLRKTENSLLQKCQTKNKKNLFANISHISLTHISPTFSVCSKIQSSCF